MRSLSSQLSSSIEKHLYTVTETKSKISVGLVFQECKDRYFHTVTGPNRKLTVGLVCKSM